MKTTKEKIIEGIVYALVALFLFSSGMYVGVNINSYQERDTNRIAHCELLENEYNAKDTLVDSLYVKVQGKKGIEREHIIRTITALDFDKSDIYREWVKHCITVEGMDINESKRE